MGLFSFVGSLIGGGKAKKASKKAQAAQVEALNNAIAEQRRQFDLTRSDYQPYLLTGLSGLSGLGDLVGVNGDEAQQAGLLNIENSPALAAIIRHGTEGVLQNASATGGVRGGNTINALADFRGDAFAGQLQQQIARLAGLAGLGQGATDAVSSFGANTSNNVSNLLGQIGDANAGGILTRGGINSQLWNNAGGFADSLASSFLPGGGGIQGFLKGLF